MEGLEDDIELPVITESAAAQAPPRKLSRLKKAAEVARVETPESEAPRSLAPASSDDDLAERAAAGQPEVRPGPACGRLNATRSRAMTAAAPATRPEQVGDDGAAAAAEAAEAAAPAEDEEEASAEESGSESEGEEQKEGAEGGEPDGYDEEEELENYLKRRFDGGGGESSSSDDDDDASAAAGDGADADDAAARRPRRALGPNATLDELNAETQRILRDTAARDRLGRGQKIEVRPLTGVVAKLLERRALAIARAPKAAPPAPPSFDDVFADAAGAGAGEAGTPAKARAPSSSDAEGEDGSDADGALEVVPDAAARRAGGVTPRLVEVPGSAARAPRPSPLTFAPPTADEELDFEEEVLIDDGAASGAESDAESDRSWQVRPAAAPGATPARGRGAAAAAAAEEDEESDGDVAESGEESSALVEETEGEEESGDEEEAPGSAAGGAAAATAAAAIALPAAGAGVDAPGPAPRAAAAAPPKHARCLQRAFLDNEAELSDEEGAGAAVSEDEDEGDDDVDAAGELADLIKAGAGGERAKDVAAKGELHRKWEEQREARDLQNVLRGLENGFRGRRAGALGEGDDSELGGRWRRARDEGEDEEGAPREFAWPAGFAGGGGAGEEEGEEACEDEEVLRRAKQARLLAEAARSPGGGGARIDDDSRAVLGLLASSQQAFAGSQGGGSQARAPPALGSDPGGAAPRAPTFLGRQPSLVRRHDSGPAAGSGGGGNGGRSYVFGRDGASNSAPGLDRAASAGAAADGPSNFADLRNLAGLPPTGKAGGAKRARGASTLVSRLGRTGSAPAAAAPRGAGGVDAAAAVLQNVVMAPPARPAARR
jgi:hypothetical protein